MTTMTAPKGPKAVAAKPAKAPQRRAREGSDSQAQKRLTTASGSAPTVAISASPGATSRSWASPACSPASTRRRRPPRPSSAARFRRRQAASARARRARCARRGCPQQDLVGLPRHGLPACSGSVAATRRNVRCGVNACRRVFGLDPMGEQAGGQGRVQVQQRGLGRRRRNITHGRAPRCPSKPTTRSSTMRTAPRQARRGGVHRCAARLASRGNTPKSQRHVEALGRRRAGCRPCSRASWSANATMRAAVAASGRSARNRRCRAPPDPASAAGPPPVMPS